MNPIIKTNPKISIITVVYNGVKHLEPTILSVVNQTYPNIEYIIIDGGSTDGTMEIIKKFENKISKWVSEPDKGIYDAMNKGVSMATGEWVNFMNAGDSFYTHKTIEDLVNNIDAELNLIYGDTILTGLKDQLEVYKVSEEFDKITKTNPFCHQSVFVKRDLFAISKFNLRYRISADYDFFLYLFYHRLIMHKKVSFAICFYDMNGLSNGLKTLKENHQIIKKYYPFSYWRFYHLYLWLRAVISFNLKRILPKTWVQNIIALKRRIKKK